MKRNTFPRGIHPPELKDLTAEKPIEVLPPPEKVFVPLSQHFGKPAQPLVKKGDVVYLGQKIGDASSLFSASVHAPVSGKVVSIDDYNHPCGKPVPTVTIANDGQDLAPSERPEENGKGPRLMPAEDPFSLSSEEICQKVREAGVVGLGGAAFPTAVKLSPPKDANIDTIIINGCECEPLLTGDYRLMMEYPEDILQGAEIIRLAASAKKVVVGIEDNKIKAFETLQRYLNGFPIELSLLKTKYPQGAEKNLIFALLRRAVPRGGLPFNVGVVVQNVGTAKAVWDAVKKGTPLYERVITCSGPGIKEPKNVLVRIGTPVQNVIDFCGGLNDGANLLIIGGPMMGVSQWSLDVPLIKGTSGILAWLPGPQPREYSCIRCARCVDHCPMGLVPTQLAKFIKYENLEEAEAWGVLDCVECGCCQYICPSNIPLVHWIRLGKSSVSSLKSKKRAG
ncbi:MAG: electron transport complex subunit RsxC [Candidatus Aminicenantales bacterium]